MLHRKRENVALRQGLNWNAGWSYSYKHLSLGVRVGRAYAGFYFRKWRDWRLPKITFHHWYESRKARDSRLRAEQGITLWSERHDR